jgi:hypothetical protein
LACNDEVVEWRVEVAFWLSVILAGLKVVEFFLNRVRIRVSVQQNMVQLPSAQIYVLSTPGKKPNIGPRVMVVTVRADPRNTTTLEQLVFRRWKLADDHAARRQPDSYGYVNMPGYPGQPLPFKLGPGTTWTGTVVQEDVDSMLAENEVVQVGVRDSVTGRTWWRRVLPTRATPD